MASSGVQTAVNARLAGWSLIGTWPALTPNTLAAASPAQKFLAVEYPVANEERLDLGQDTVAQYREDGAIRFVLNLLDLAGLADANTASESLRDLFRDAEFGGVVTYEASAPAFNKDNRRGAFYQIPVVVTYHYDYSKTRQP
jgi:hypothetical protein